MRTCDNGWFQHAKAILGAWSAVQIAIPNTPKQAAPKSSAMKYPVEAALPEERTAATASEDGLLSLQSGCDSNGIKGPTALGLLPIFNIVWGVSVHYMHTVLLGVTRQLTEHWLQYTSGGCYIGALAKLSDIENALCAVKPPISFTRLPRSLKEWKTGRRVNEKKLAPLLRTSFPQGHSCRKYRHHYELLSESIFFMLRQTVSSEDTDCVNSLMIQFVCNAQASYSKEFMTFNVHQLLHLPECVSKMGPLWASSFLFPIWEYKWHASYANKCSQGCTFANYGTT